MSKKWTPRGVGIEQSETGRLRISGSEPDSLTADARAKPFRETLPAHMTFEEVVRFREERMRKAERDWAQVRAARRQRTAEKNRQRWQAKYRADPWKKVETGIWERGNRRKVVWCEPNSETGDSEGTSEYFPLVTPLKKLRAFREAKQRAGAPVRAARRDARKRKTEEQRPLKEERARLGESASAETSATTRKDTGSTGLSQIP